ncbi:MAG: carboxypeptidase-like regulatory domain-containing protein, partial [Gemmatimonadetes bacterium]|nr:carboxypeptidase-like regulatory domain-containing protein [Gemmatimonadota bacterium]
MEHSENEHPLPGRIMLATVRHQHDWRVLLPWGIVVLILLALPPGLQAQAPGVVTGRVSDALTDESLPGATVRIDSTSIGVASDLDGDFRISRVPSGAQVLVVSFIGYKTQRIPISVPSGEVLHLDVQLSFDTIEGEEIVILAQAEGQIKAINQQLASNTIVNVVSAARIRELPDVNAAESVGRLPGVSIIRNAGEGQKVVIRGLSPEYNNVLVNGQRIPGTDSNDRSTDLSMISSDMLAGIEVVKALTPDRDADMIGGTIDFRLRDAPDGFRSDVRLQTGYSGQQEVLGFYKGNLQLSQRFFGNRLGVLGQVNVERADRSSDVFSAGYNRDQVTLEEGETPRLEIGSLNLSDRTEIRHRYGGSLILDYRLPNGRIQFSNFFRRLNRDEVRFSKNYGLGGRTVTYGIRDREIISDVLSNTLQGNLRVAGSELDFAASHAVAHQDRPYDNEFEFLELAAFTPDLIVDQGPEVIPQSAKNILDETHLRNGDHYGINNQERDLSASFNLRTPFVLGRKISGYTKFGAKYRTKQRSNEETRSYLPYYFGEGANYVRAAFPDTDLEATSQGFIPLTSFLNPNHDVSNFLDGQYDLSVALDRDLMNEAYEGVSDRYFISKFAAMNDFEMKETITAGYAM